MKTRILIALVVVACILILADAAMAAASWSHIV